jgi:hypothetical protein
MNPDLTFKKSKNLIRSKPHGDLLSFIWVGGDLNDKREVAMSYMAISAFT